MPAICDDYEIQVEHEDEGCMRSGYYFDESPSSERRTSYTKNETAEPYRIIETQRKEVDAGSIFLSANLHRIFGESATSRSTLQAEFDSLAARWQEETWFMSNADNMARNSAYQEIIKMGMPVVPMILKEMQREPDHWFWALNAITGHNAVQKAHAGDVEAMTEDWLNWGRKNRFI